MLARPRATTPLPRRGAVVEVFVRPLFDLAADPAGARYVRFLAALYAERDWLPVLDAGFAPQWARIEPVLARATRTSTPFAAARACRWRARPCSACSPIPTATAATCTPTPYRDEVIDVFTAIVTAPSHAQEAP